MTQHNKDAKPPAGGLLAIESAVDAELLDFDGPLRGRLDVIPLGTVLVRASAQRASGTLTIARGRVKKVLYLIRGEPIFIDSNLRGESLGAYLLAHGLLDEGRLADALRKTKESKRRLADELRKLGWVEPSQIEAGQQAQARVRLVDALRWSDGMFSFLPGVDFSERVPRYPVEVVPLVLGALSRLARDGDLEQQFTKWRHFRVIFTPLGRGQLNAILRVFGDEMLRVEGAGASVESLLQRAPDRPALLGQLLALHTAELIRLEPPDEPGVQGEDELLHLHDLGPSTASGEVERSALKVESSEGLEDADSGIIEIPSEWSAPSRPAPSRPAPEAVLGSLAGESPQREEKQLEDAVSGEAARLEAEIAFREAQGRLRQHQPQRAVELLERAVALDEEQAESHALLGWARHLVAGRGSAGAAAARPHLTRALELEPESTRAHELAAQIEADAEERAAAAQHLERALRSGPPRIDLFGRLREILLALGELDRLEAQYRRMVLRLRDSDPRATGELWLDLAYLYKDRLGRDHEARMALEVAEKLLPTDPRLEAARAALELAHVPWEQIAESQRQRFFAEPGDPAPLHSLFQLHLEGGRDDLAQAVAAILVSRGHAFAEERQWLAERPRRVPARALAPEVLMVMRHPDDDPQLEELVAALAPTLEQVLPLDRGALGLRSVSPAELPRRVAGALHQACLRLDVRLPALCLAKAAIGVAPLPGSSAQLVISEQLLGEGVNTALVHFAIARALSCLSTGRREVFLRRGSQLRLALSALLTLTQGTTPPQPDPRHEALCATLRRQESFDQIVAVAESVIRATQSVNFSAWMRAVRRTSARIGAAAANDLGIGLSALSGEADAYSDLIGFVLSARYAWIAARDHAPTT